MTERKLVDIGRVFVGLGALISAIDAVETFLTPHPHLGVHFALVLGAIVVGAFSLKQIPKLGWIIVALVLGYLEGGLGGGLIVVGCIIALIGDYA